MINIIDDLIDGANLNNFKSITEVVTAILCGVNLYDLLLNLTQ